MQTYSLATLGCKVNQYDGNAVAWILRRAGWAEAEPDGPADLVVVNTCCVTATAMRKSRQVIRKTVRKSPNAAVLVVGCYSDYDAKRIGKVLSSAGVPPDRAIIAGHHARLVSLIEGFLDRLSADPNKPSMGSADRVTGQSDGQGNEVCMSADGLAPGATSPDPTSMRQRRMLAVKKNIPPCERLGEIDRFAGHQRAFVKVQDGCDAFCTYCIVPYTRCHVWSKPIDAVEDECRRLVGAGHREIVLSGVFLGAFGRKTALRRRWGKNERSKLPDLLRRVARIDGLWRVRLSSLEPGDLSEELLAVCDAEPTVAPHFHLPLQSGSQRILRRMNRQYDAGQFRRTIARLRERLDNPAVTTDIIVGFPGETDEDFAATLDVARWAEFAKIHAFAFSAVEPTAAWQWRKETPPRAVVRRRLEQLAELEAELAAGYRRRFVGRTMEGLVERSRPGRNELRRAMTDRYLTVDFQAPPAKRLTGKVVKLRIDRASDKGLDATLLD